MKKEVKEKIVNILDRALEKLQMESQCHIHKCTECEAKSACLNIIKSINSVKKINNVDK